jgi:hypothetical protein
MAQTDEFLKPELVCFKSWKTFYHFLRSKGSDFRFGLQRTSETELRFFQPINQKSIPIFNGHMGSKDFGGCQIESTPMYQQRRMSFFITAIPFYAYNISCKIRLSMITSRLHRSTFMRALRRLWEFIRSGYLVTKLGKCRLVVPFSIIYVSWLNL